MNYLMESFLNYILLLFVFCLLEIGLLQYYKRKGIEVKRGFIVGYQILIGLLVTIFTITGIPGIHNLIIQNDKCMNFILYLENIFSFECRMNMIMFVPIGIIIPLLWKNSRKLYLVLIMGFSLSLFIEISQLFNYRASDINDLFTNVCGTLIGYIIFKFFLNKFNILELDDHHRVSRLHSFFQIIMISFVYFVIGAPIISLIRGF